MKICLNYPLVCRNLVFQIVGSSHQWSLYLVIREKVVQLKTTTLLVFLWLVKSLKYVNNRLTDHREKCGRSDFHYGFRFSLSTANILRVVSDRIDRAFNRSGAIRAVGLGIFKAFDRVWHAGLHHTLQSFYFVSNRL